MDTTEEPAVVSPPPREPSGVVYPTSTGRRPPSVLRHNDDGDKPRLMEAPALLPQHSKLKTEYSPHTTGFIFRVGEFDLENSSYSNRSSSRSNDSRTTMETSLRLWEKGGDDSKKSSGMSLAYSEDTGFFSFDFERLSMQTKSFDDATDLLWMPSRHNEEEEENSLNLSAAFRSPTPTKTNSRTQKDISHQTSATFLESPLTLGGEESSFSSHRTFNSSFVKDSIVTSPCPPSSSSSRRGRRRGGRRNRDSPSPAASPVIPQTNTLKNTTRSSSIGKILSVPFVVVSPDPDEDTTKPQLTVSSDRCLPRRLLNPLSPAPEGPKWKSARDVYSSSRSSSKPQTSGDGLNEISRILLQRRQQRVLQEELEREAKQQQQLVRPAQYLRRPSSSSPLRRRISSTSSTGGVIVPNQAPSRPPPPTAAQSRRHAGRRRLSRRASHSLSPIRSSRGGAGGANHDFLSSSLPPMSFVSAATSAATHYSSAPSTPDQVLERVENGSFRLRPLSSSTNGSGTQPKQVLTVVMPNQKGNVPIPQLPQIQVTSSSSPKSPPKLPPPRDNINTPHVTPEPAASPKIVEPLRDKEASKSPKPPKQSTRPKTPVVEESSRKERSRSRKPQSGKRHRTGRSTKEQTLKDSHGGVSKPVPLSTMEELLAMTRNGKGPSNGQDILSPCQSQENQDSNRRSSQSPKRHQDHSFNRRSKSPHKKRSSRSRSGRRRKSRTPSPEKKRSDSRTHKSSRRTPSPHHHHHHHKRRPESPPSSSRSHHHHQKSFPETKSTKRPSASMSPRTTDRSSSRHKKDKSSRSKSPRAGKPSSAKQSKGPHAVSSPEPRTSSPRRSLAQSLKDLQTLDHLEKPALPLHLVPSVSGGGGDDSTTEPTLPSTLTGPSSHTLLRKKDPRTTATPPPLSPHRSDKDKSARTTTHHSRAERLSADHWDVSHSSFTLDEWSASDCK